jgi:hypothetical protein
MKSFHDIPPIFSLNAKVLDRTAIGTASLSPHTAQWDISLMDTPKIVNRDLACLMKGFTFSLSKAKLSAFQSGYVD